ncbi:hypothetical protein ACFXPI_12200 [Streptomyces sp. NPDC059104]|uniref:hypothetical protein n=1 Tax=Streptomyces sp. NPDC059104 TaxID=3346729 RepID=UPI00368377B5
MDCVKVLAKWAVVASVISGVTLVSTPAFASTSGADGNGQGVVSEIVVNQDIPGFHTVNFSDKPCPASHPWLAKTGHLTPGRVGPREGWSVEEPGWVGVGANYSGVDRTPDPDVVFYTGIKPQATNYSISPKRLKITIYCTYSADLAARFW